MAGRITSFLSTLSLRRATVPETLVPRRYQFLSTLSLRRATGSGSAWLASRLNFYPRSPCGERPTKSDQGASNQRISIHALLAESDSLRQLQSALCRNFYPRSPCGERLKPIFGKIDTRDFYPRSPCGERLTTTTTICTVSKFLSTLSLRRATALGLLGWLRVLISIHALLAESDMSPVDVLAVSALPFLSTLSLRRATHQE